MTQVTRREAVRELAAGAAVAGAGGLAAPAAGATSAAGAGDFDVATEATFAAARRSGAAGEPRTWRTAAARVAHCRSWDSSVYLHVDPSTRGFVRLSPQGFAIAAAAQAAGRAVAVRCWGHDALADDGVGRFEGAQVAFDPRDLPEAPGDSLIG